MILWPHASGLALVCKGVPSERRIYESIFGRTDKVVPKISTYQALFSEKCQYPFALFLLPQARVVAPNFQSVVYYSTLIALSWPSNPCFSWRRRKQKKNNGSSICGTPKIPEEEEGKNAQKSKGNRRKEKNKANQESKGWRVGICPPPPQSPIIHQLALPYKEAFVVRILDGEVSESSRRLRADFRQGDEDSNLSVFRVWRFTEWPGPLH